MDSLSQGSMQLSFCNLYCLVPSQISSETDSSSEWSSRSWTCCAFIFYFYFLLYVFSGSVSGKEQTPAIAPAAPCSIVCYRQKIQNIKAHCFFFPLGDTGELCIISPPLGWSLPFIHISFRFCLNSNMSPWTFFCHSVITCNSSHLLSSIKLWPWHGRFF